MKHFIQTLNVRLCGYPLYSRERTKQHPLIIAGGHSTFNPEPMHAFIDAFIIGEGEDVINEVVDIYKSWKMTTNDREVLLHNLAQLWGVYVPSHYEVTYHNDGTVMSIKRLTENTPISVQKRIMPRLTPPPTRFIVPNIEIIHNRIPIEIMRGCTRGCRFCQAGMITRPVRNGALMKLLKQ
jgi:radical SAM superfamily enzyme YgiQ (UPF0313 family)